MPIYILKRLTLAVLVALTVSAVTFALLNMTGDLAMVLAGGEDAAATAEELAQIRQQYGLDRSLMVRYLEWLGGLFQGNFGTSFFSQEDVLEMIIRRLPVTLRLGLSALIFALVVSVPLGVFAAMRPNSLLDRACLSIAVFGQALPNFFFGLLLIIFLGVKLGILPIFGSDTWVHYIMPTITLSSNAIPPLMRLTRNGMLEALDSDYIRTARAKGLSELSVLFKHCLRNAVIPVVSLAAVQLGNMLNGSIITESIFALDGIGLLAWESIDQGDFPVVQSIVLMVSTFYIVLTLFADLLNAALDPRIREE